jgi:7-carboxy-7-deazaguanine synthase
MHAVDADSVRKRAKWLTWSEIVSLLREYRCYCDWVVLSGGNPLIHELSGLVDHLHLDRWKVAVETQGSYYRDWVRVCDSIVISPKGPGMGERCDLSVLDNFVSHVSNCNTAFKIVIFGPEDLEFAYSIKRRYTWAPLPMYLSVGHKVETNEGVIELLARYRWIIEKVARDSAWTDVHILPQMHVLLWGNELGR